MVNDVIPQMPAIKNDMTDFLEQLLADARAGKVVGVAIVWTGGADVSFKNFGGGHVLLSAACSYAAWKLFDDAIKPSGPTLFVPRGVLPSRPS
jgi:hypothetical protein